jgi:predicted NAD-dependent protein-ADP-ribosyltransferase YbiA (DUF1768 family)
MVEIKFKCAEQYMMYNKAIVFGDNNIGRKILQIDEPSKMKSWEDK